jgi:hypothetical protein
MLLLPVPSLMLVCGFVRVRAGKKTRGGSLVDDDCAFVSPCGGGHHCLASTAASAREKEGLWVKNPK